MLLLLSLFSILFNHSCLFIEGCSNLDAEIVTLLLLMLLLLDLTLQLLASLSLYPIIFKKYTKR